MTIELEQVPGFFLALRNRWRDRDERMALMDNVVKGEWSLTDPDDDDIESRSPNIVQVALEDTAEAASFLPTVRVDPSGTSKAAKAKASAMEQLAASYLDLSKMPLLAIKSFQDLAAFGLFCWVVAYDPESKSPVIQWRDPRTCWPEFGHRPWDSVRTCMFSREIYVRQLSKDHQQKVRDRFGKQWEEDAHSIAFHDRKVTLVELYDEEQILIVAMYTESGMGPMSRQSSWIPVELDRIDTPARICPVVVGSRLVLDNEPRGQFDQVVGMMQAHIRLMSMVLDYSDQAVYSDIYVSDLVGQMSYGGGAYIQLGPNGKIGRVPPAVTSLSVERELQQLIDNMHLAARWPKTRPGQIDQAIASAKFVEATAGMMNTVIRTYHLIMKESLEQGLNIGYKVDAIRGPERTIAGVLKNQQFMVSRSKDDIDLGAKVRVDYGIGLGRDPAQSLVLGIQGAQTGIWSNDFVQENFDGLTDIERERRRIDVGKFKDMAFAQLLQGLQGGTIPGSALVQIAKARENGDDIFELYQKYVVAPAEEQQASMLTNGVTGEQVAPGTGPAALGGPLPPAPPDGGGLLAALGGGPPPQGGAESISRLSVPAGGPGSFAGTTVRR